MKRYGREGEKLESKINGNLFYYFGERRGYRGTGFYLHKNVTDRVIVVKGISERISLLKLRIQENVNLSVIQVYGPTLDSNENDKEKFYKLLNETMDEEKEYYNIVMGDWNSKVGQEAAIEGIKGPYGIGEMNENGERMIEFAGSHNLKIANTFFNKDKKLKWTWMSPDGQIRNEIDHILINDLRIVSNVVCLPAFVFPSDHRIVRSTLNIKKRRRYGNYRVKSSKNRDD